MCMCVRTCVCVLSDSAAFFHDQNSANKESGKLHDVESQKAVRVSFPKLRTQGKMSAIKDEKGAAC